MLDETPSRLILMELTKELCREEDREPGSMGLQKKRRLSESGSRPPNRKWLW